jgi:hypothetical protein
MQEGLLNDPVRCAKWSKEVGADLADSNVLASLMLKSALMENPESVILFSSKSQEHMRRNVETACDTALEAPAKNFYSVVQATAKHRRTVEAGG